MVRLGAGGAEDRDLLAAAVVREDLKTVAQFFESGGEELGVAATNAVAEELVGGLVQLRDKGFDAGINRRRRWLKKRFVRGIGSGFFHKSILRKSLHGSTVRRDRPEALPRRVTKTKSPKQSLGAVHCTAEPSNE